MLSALFSHILGLCSSLNVANEVSLHRLKQATVFHVLILMFVDV
jgi:hypothetical protein